MNLQLPLFAPRERADPWTVRTSRRARRLSVRVYPGGRVEVVVPPGASAGLVQRFIGEHRTWIDRRVRELAGQGVPADPKPASIDLPAIGRRYSIDYLDRDSAPRIQLAASGGLLVAGSHGNARALAHALRRWLMRLAQAEFESAVADVAGGLGLRYSQVQARRQRTRWGSCSAAGTISLNVCVLFQEPDVMRYLLVHELCHTRHMNHSARFWSLVESFEPDYRRLDRELSQGWRRVPGWVFG